MSTKILTIDKLFLFYEGLDPKLYTELTGINLNKNARILAGIIDDIYDKLGDGTGNTGSTTPLSDDPELNDPDTGASTVATKTIMDKIGDLLSDDYLGDQSDKGASTKATTKLYNDLLLKIGQVKMTPSTETPAGKIPNQPKIPVTYVGKDGDRYLSSPREWVEVTTPTGKGLIPVYDIGTIIDER